MSDIQSLNLQVDEVQWLDGRIKIKSNNRTYTFFKLKQDGSATQAFEAFQSLNVQQGQTFNFGIKEVPGNYQGKPITYRNIVTIKPATGEQTWSQPAQANSKGTHLTLNDAFTYIGALKKKIQELEDRVAILETNEKASNLPQVESDDLNPADIPF